MTRNGRRNILAGEVAGLGGAIAIGAMEWFSVAAHTPLAVIPFATSIVLVIGSPEAEPAQPRALIGGHPVPTLVGVRRAEVGRAAGLGGGGRRRPVGVRAMYLTGTFHPPAGINPLLVVSNNLPWSFLLAPGARRRAVAGRVRLCLAPRASPPAMAAALALKNRRGYGVRSALADDAAALTLRPSR